MSNTGGLGGPGKVQNACSAFDTVQKGTEATIGGPAGLFYETTIAGNYSVSGHLGTCQGVSPDKKRKKYILINVRSARIRKRKTSTPLIR